jgi:hypothetical protein
LKKRSSRARGALNPSLQLSAASKERAESNQPLLKSKSYGLLDGLLEPEVPGVELELLLDELLGVELPLLPGAPLLELPGVLLGE